MTHKHKISCTHNKLKYCTECNAPYCEDCGREWAESITTVAALSPYIIWSDVPGYKSIRPADYSGSSLLD